MSGPSPQPSPAGAGEGADASTAGAGVGTGSCLCGAVRYRFALPVLWVAHCHCTICRRAQGAAFVTWAGTDGASFELLGDVDALRTYRSSPEATRSFCGRCGTPLFFESSRWPGELHVTLASVDPAIAEKLQPEGHVHYAMRVRWLGELHDGLPRYEAGGAASS